MKLELLTAEECLNGYTELFIPEEMEQFLFLHDLVMKEIEKWKTYNRGTKIRMYPFHNFGNEYYLDVRCYDENLPATMRLSMLGEFTDQVVEACTIYYYKNEHEFATNGFMKVGTYKGKKVKF